jgi:hypothetical protein
MPTTITIGGGKAKTSAEFNLLPVLVGLAAIFAGYEVANKYDLIQRAEALFYGFPSTRVQATQDLKQLGSLLSYAQTVGDTGLQTLVQGRINAINQGFPGAGSPTSTGTPATGQPTIATSTTPSSTTTTAQTTAAMGSGTATAPTTSIVPAAPAATGSSAIGGQVGQAALATGVPIPSNAGDAITALAQLDAIWWINPGNTALRSYANIEANYIRQQYPQAGPAAGYTYNRLLSIFPQLPPTPPTTALGTSLILGGS